MPCWSLVYSSDSGFRTYVCIYTYVFLLRTVSHCGLSQDIKYSWLSYPVGPRCVSSLQITVRVCSSQPPRPSLPTALPRDHCQSLLCLSPLLFHRHVRVCCFLLSTCAWGHSTFVPLQDLLHSVAISSSVHVAAAGIIPFSSVAE